MNYYQYFLNSKGNRDSVFDYVLNCFNEKPINILEIGATRDLNLDSRQGDGWSTLHFVKYLNSFGGHLDICDISILSLENSELILKDSPAVSKKLFLSTGLDRLKENNQYDLIFLDGGDNPNEMIDEYNLINVQNTKILCDDFHSKGNKLRELNSNFILFKWENNAHEMAFYNNNETNTILLSPIQ